MGFSDWITIAAILAAVLLGFFKYYEWEVIRHKKPLKYFWLPFFCFLCAGIAAFFHTNPHPAFLDWFWTFGIYVGYWPVIWIIFTVISFFLNWWFFTHQEPENSLIALYYDILREKDKSVFNSLFYKYEKGFVSGNVHWENYPFVLHSSLFWLAFPIKYERKIYQILNQRIEEYMPVLGHLLKAQLSNLPNNSLAIEIDSQWNGLKLNEDTPTLNLYLKDANRIERLRDRGIFLPTIADAAQEYYQSAKFLSDLELLKMGPLTNPDQGFIPHGLLPFYFIRLVDLYWQSVIKTEAQVSTFYFFETWTRNLLKKAPDLDEKENGDEPNLFCFAVREMIESHKDNLRRAKDGSENISWAVKKLEKNCTRLQKLLKEEFATKVPVCYYEDEPH